MEGEAHVDQIATERETAETGLFQSRIEMLSGEDAG